MTKLLNTKNIIYLAALILTINFQIMNSISIKSKTDLQNVPDGWFHIVDDAGYCLEYKGKEGRVFQNNCCNTDSMLWKGYRQGEGHIFENKSGLVLDNHFDHTQNGNDVITWDRNNTPAQIWVVEPSENGFFQLRNPHANRCLDDTGDKGVGKFYHIWDCNKNNNQRFKFTTPGSSTQNLPQGWFQIVEESGFCLEQNGKEGRVLQQNCCNKDTMLWKAVEQNCGVVFENKNGLILDNHFDHTNNGNDIITWDRNNSGAQIWAIEPSVEGYHQVRNLHANRCLDDTGDKGVGKFYHIWDCNKNNNQRFKFRTPQSVTQNLPQGWFNIVEQSGFCLAENGKEKRVVQQTCSSSESLMWKAEEQSCGVVFINKNGLILDNHSDLTNNGNDVIVWDRNNSGAQIWNVEPSNVDGYYQIRNVHANRCLDDTGKKGVNELYHIWDCNKNENQKFKFSLPPAPTPVIPVPPVINVPVPPVINVPVPPVINVPVPPVINVPVVPTYTVQVPTGYFNLIGNNGLCVYSTSDNKLILGQCYSLDNGMWQFVPTNGGYQITNRVNLVLDNFNSNTNDGNPIIIFNNNHTPNQIWVPVSIGNNYFLIKNPASGKCMGVSAGFLVLVTCNNLDPNHLFRLGTPNVNHVTQPITPVPSPTPKINYHNLPNGAINPASLGPITPFVNSGVAPANGEFLRN